MSRSPAMLKHPAAIAKPDDWLAQISACITAGRLDDAEQVCRQALQAQPDNDVVQQQLGRLWMARNEFKPAWALFDTIKHRRQNDPLFHLFFGVATSQTRSEAEAIPHYEQALSLPRCPPITHERLGRAYLATEQRTLALLHLTQATIDQPQSAQAHAGVGLARISLGEETAGLASLEHAMRLQPDNFMIAWEVLDGYILAGRAESAATLMQQCIAANPQAEALKICLGRALASMDRIGEARDYFELGTRLYPQVAEIWVLLAEAKAQLGEPGDIACYRRALALNPRLLPIHMRVANVLAQQGHRDEAMEHYRLSMPWNGSAIARPADGTTLRVAILTLPLKGNTPTPFLIDHSRHHVERIMVLPDYNYPAESMRSRYDIVFNAVADADLALTAMRQVRIVADLIGAPLLNPPEAIAATTRDAMSARLSSIENAIVPRMIRMRPSRFLEREADALGDDITFPVLVRPTGSHGGDGLTKLDDGDALAAHLRNSPDEDFYFCRFVDFASADGLYRKYRIVYVGGTMMPYHMSVSEHWLNHYFSGMTADQVDFRDEEERFLTDCLTYLGPTVVAALEEIGTRVALDYFGVDFAVDRNGKLVVFECNANMLIAMPQETVLAYRQEPVRRIRERMSTMLKQRARVEPASSNESDTR